MQSIVPPNGSFSRTIKHSTFSLVTTSYYLIFVYLLRVFRHSEQPLLRKSYIFLQRPRFLPSIWSSLCIFRFLTNNERRDNWNEAYLRVLFTFNGLCQTHARHLSKESSLSLVLMWQLAPQGNAACLGRLALIAGRQWEPKNTRNGYWQYFVVMETTGFMQ